METEILETLEYRIFRPTIYNFMTRVIKIIKLTKLGRWRAHFYAERCLQEHSLLKYEESTIACAAVCLAKSAESLDIWPKEVELYTMTCLADIESAMEFISKCIPEVSVTGSNRQLTAVKKKYSNPKYMEVADVSHPEFPRKPFKEDFYND